MDSRLLDTNIVSYFVKSHSLAWKYWPHLKGRRLFISFQTLAELLEWGACSAWGTVRWSRLQTVLNSLGVLDSNAEICSRWAEIRASRRNQPISATDAWIAATALAFNIELVTHNPLDFANVPSLVVISEPA